MMHLLGERKLSTSNRKVLLAVLSLVLITILFWQTGDLRLLASDYIGFTDEDQGGRTEVEKYANTIDDPSNSAYAQSKEIASVGETFPSIVVEDLSSTSTTLVSDIVINEVNPGDPNAVELYNTTGLAIDMNDWQIQGYDFTGNLSFTYTFTITLPANAYVAVYELGNPADNTATALYSGGPFNLVSGDSAAVLKDDTGTCLDFVRWGTSSVTPPAGCTWTGANPTAPPPVQDIGRDSSSTDTDDGSDWCIQELSLESQNLGCAPPPGGISGTVTNSLDPLQSIEIYAFRESGLDWRFVELTLTDSVGQFSFSELPVGTYRVRFTDASGIYLPEYYNNKVHILSGTNITVTTGAITPNINATMDPVGEMEISGYVRTSEGDPLSGVTMQGLPDTPTTSTTGFYSDTVPFFWTGSVTPTLSGYTFLPSSRSYENVALHYMQQDYISPLPATAGVLLVDDDDNTPDTSVYYTATLDALGIAYDIWDTSNSDIEPDITALAPYSSVVWFTGAANPAQGGSPGPGVGGESALGSWLDDGGCLFITSMDYLLDKGQTTFMSDYLGLASGTNNIGWYDHVTGQGTIFGGTGTYTLTYTYDDNSDILNPAASAEQALIGNNSNGAAVNKDGGDYRTTYWGFPFDSLETAANRDEIMGVFFSWCEASKPPVITHTPVTTALVDNPLSITATVTSESPPLTATLFYSSTGDSSYSSLSMVNVGGDVYSATIPGSAVLMSTLSYYIEAEDSIGTRSDGPHQVSVVGRPVINHSPVTSAEVDISLPITATVTSKLPPLIVTLYYSSTGDSSYTSLAMTNVGGDVYSATIPAGAVLTPALSYYIEAGDGIGSSADGPHQVLVDARPVISHSPVSATEVGVTRPITAVVTSKLPPLVVTLYYSSTGDASFTSLAMLNMGGDIYSATIPAGAVLTPTLSYYIGAGDGIGSSSDGPHQVLVAEPPAINHTPVAAAHTGSSLPITATVTSEAPPLVVTLYYSNTGDSAYSGLPMVNTGSNIYSATIPAGTVLTPTLSYYIEAEDNIGLTSDGPHQVVITEPPSPPSAPILIAPTGGITNTTVTYIWEKVSNADEYLLLVLDDQSSEVHNTSYQAIDICSGSTCEVTSSASLAYGAYVWSVKAQNNLGFAWSTEQQFDVEYPFSVLLPFVHG